MSYWVASLGLVVFGVVGMFSIGRPFLLVGLALLVLGPLRSRPVLYWPPLAAVIADNVGYWAIAPLSCTATEAVGGASATVCFSLISGSGTYNPSLDPANQAGLLLAAAAFVIVLAVMLRSGRAGRVAPVP